MDIEELLAKYGGSTPTPAPSVELPSSEQGIGVHLKCPYIFLYYLAKLMALSNYCF